MEDVKSPIQHHFCVSRNNEYYLPSINRNTFEKIDSKTLYKGKFGSELFKTDTLHIIIGLDSGLLANYVLDNQIGAGSKYLFIELDPILELLTVEIPNEVKNSFHVLTLDEFILHLESGIDDLYLVKNQVSIHNSFASLAPYLESYTQLNTDVSKLLEHRTLDQKSGFNQKIFFKQQLKNCAENQQPASVLRNKFDGKTCIIAGGGPSLDNDIEWMKSNYDQLFIIAVSRVAAKLSDEGIKVHIIVSVDPQEHSFEVSRSMMRLYMQSLFVNSFHVNHRILSQWQGKSLYLGQNLPWVEEDFDNIETIGPTVTNSAVRLAIELGFKQILLTGADFCYTSSGMTHAAGSVESKSGPNLSLLGEWVETNCGETAETVAQLLFAAKSLEQEVENHPNVDVINLSKDAIKIPGIAYRKKHDITIVPAECTPKDLMLMVKELRITALDFLKSKKITLGQALKDIKKIEAFADSALKTNRTAKDNFNNLSKHHKYVEKIERIEKKINSKHREMAQVIKYYGYFEFSKFLTTRDESNWSIEHMNQMTHDYYYAFKKLTKELAPLIEQAQDKISIRLEELNPNPNILKLTKHWEKDNEPGRAIVFSQNTSTQTLASLGNDERQQLRLLVNKYQEQLTSTEHSYFSIKNNHKSLHRTHIKILELFKKQNSTGLKNLAENLKELSLKDNYAKRMMKLATCHYHMLKENYDMAIDELIKLDDNLKTETEYKIILSLSLRTHNLELSELTLANISKLNDEYAPQFAHILQLRDKPQEALNVYLDYLDKYPEDIPVTLKLGIFLAEVGQIDGAKSCFLQVLDIDPDNHAAQNYLQQIAAH
ncbi:6-hydroxymethylpterin diphosphokinase MptE-like protein [Shewanella waksmanii]|uniref:motility associated factor glycosyltransferase family protein n=1 Tax=Shewanella waksmanii TaxID=213783 RepID=UPI003735C37D